LKEEDFEIGKLIFAFVLDRWERAFILSKERPQTKTVKVFCIDWGTVGNLHISQCRILKEKWSLEFLPKMAHRGILHGVQPIDEKLTWDLNLTHEFLDQVRNVKLKMKVVKFDEKVNF
jgi:hypothetical protein